MTDVPLMLEKPQWKTILPDVVGLGVLAAEVEIIGIAASSWGAPIWAWVLAYMVLAIVALFTWHGEKWPKESRKALKMVLGSLLLGGVFLLVDVIVGHSDHPEFSLVKAAESAGGPFGFGLTMLVCPVTTAVLLAGYFRAVFLRVRHLVFELGTETCTDRPPDIVRTFPEAATSFVANQACSRKS
jgi:RsiW-degrading membrane proteinase PrsW (M82 family)